MEINLVVDKDMMEYQINNAGDEYKEALLHYGFEEKNHLLIKSYNKNTFMYAQDKEMLEKNFRSCLQEVVNHTLGKTTMDWEKSLEVIACRMEKNNIKWWLAGSAACAIRGINIIPKDIDVMTYKTEIKKIEKGFKDTTIEPFHYVTDWFVKGFGVVYLKGRVDIAFEPEESSDADQKVDFGCYAMNNLEVVEWKGYSIYVPPVELHIYPNKARGRNDRVKKIEEYMKHNLKT
ncbi:nucleotidyltransferase family protein [Haloplasma contractile]|uniref:Uncharacterized protein n=1 Tax=Haloplasma contractile SSD-17B TaxID=1033810 RepID=U2DS72_9MOLU|nr:hypothetical protein [Haloplasma contractile]ERJ11397.1 hypothetical protein HLPCO_002519 [Haloplasma contractile SSD-17B]